MENTSELFAMLWWAWFSSSIMRIAMAFAMCRSNVIQRVTMHSLAAPVGQLKFPFWYECLAEDAYAFVLGIGLIA